MQLSEKEPMLREVGDTRRQFSKDLSCGLSVYVGFDSKKQAWCWTLDGYEISEKSYGESYEQCLTACIRHTRALLSTSLNELTNG